MQACKNKNENDGTWHNKDENNGTCHLYEMIMIQIYQNFSNESGSILPICWCRATTGLNHDT